MTYRHNPQLTPLARNLRKNMTKEERRLWYGFLREYPVRILRQKVIEQYIVDFYCRKANLVIEVDGSQHYDPEGQEKDRIRTQTLQKYGLAVLRIPNNEVNRNFEGVCQWIDMQIKARLPHE